MIRRGTIAIIFTGGFITFGLLFLNKAQAQAPGIPQNFTATATSSCGVELAWTQPDSADYFQFRSRVGTGSFGTGIWSTIPNLSGSGNKKFTHTLLDPSTIYQYQVRACNNIGGCGAPSATSQASTPVLPSVSRPPTNLKTERWYSDQGPLELSWVPDSNELDTATSGFRVFRSDDSGASFKPFGTFTLGRFRNDGNKWTDAVGTDNLYEYKIKAYQTDSYCKSVDNNTAEGSAWVNFSGDSSVLIVPPRPASVGVAATRNNSTEARFSWSDSSLETKYDFELSEKPSFSPSTSSVYSANTTSSVWFTFRPGLTYYYRVRACNESSGNSACSDWRSSTFTSSYPAPINLKAYITYASSAAQKGDVYLIWDENGASYDRRARIYRKTLSEPSFPSAPLVEISPVCFGSPPSCSLDNFYLDQNIDFGETYQYEVRFFIVDENRETGPSNTASANLNIAAVLRGVGWSSAEGGSAGWIKFNSAPEPGQTGSIPHNYSVQVDRDGLMSGEAWASIDGNGHGYGWLSFNSADLENCPSGPCEARLDLTTGIMTGWARFLAPLGFASGESSWDGWVSLRGNVLTASLDKPFSALASIFKSTFSPLSFLWKPVNAQGATYGVLYDPATHNFSGAAWGNDIAGWIAFGPTTVSGSTRCPFCTVRAEIVNRAPSVSNVIIENGPPVEEWCAAQPYFSVRWTYSDPDGDPQKKAEIKFVGPTTLTRTDNTNDTSYIQNKNYILNDPLSVLAPNSSYNAEVRVFDGTNWSHEANAAWPASSVPEVTPTHYPPLVDFEWSPTGVTRGSITTFDGKDGTARTTDRSGGSYPADGISSSNPPIPPWTWEWDFSGNATPNQPRDPKVSVIFNNLPSDVSLKVTDGSGASCTALKNIGGGAGTGLKRRIFREKQN